MENKKNKNILERDVEIKVPLINLICAIAVLFVGGILTGIMYG